MTSSTASTVASPAAFSAGSTAVPQPHPLPLAFGDLQGCRTPFQQLLAKAAPPEGTPLWFAGDLINRGSESLATLRDIIALGDRAVPVLGNHDLHLLSVSAGIRKSKKGDTIDDILAAPDAADLLEWVRHRPLAHFEHGMLMVHAGVLPQWDAALTMELADELQRALRAPNWKETLAGLYGNEPNRWTPGIKGIERLRLTCSALTRIRFCDAEGAMDFSTSGGLNSAPPGSMPWFDVPSRKTADITVVFGHWAALGLTLRDNLIGLDSGCVWGEKLSAVRLAQNPVERTLTQVDCETCRVAGGGN
ncbi:MULTISPECIES: symmetrical bis(5'-nucleosyl)-tetraphosphatase [Paraburkholderia]|uniref:Bis(5'-nucleosyl)-tetraphosphatase, symmetrical n=1 Tax=Paraburkholderia nemoris TaxID=2793076 RepID=A0ABN7KMY5_9BURK|nr:MULTISPECIES: symmetrical bis(5'-nucleosyl)-tetraphosphatase [Paraburkholderia]MBK3808764.1 symmetrical bis(5'-nucleosyl)-tetraphosphatase [Paraburkholderia aspalathi]MCP2086956.1 bis(5'-nucleosyl)-tetraphosphatase (symmetrical) [Paraburkholderia sediminicola]CAE6702164.1 Bis(5'-nucleosyl)-tetraphosphatase, symmetrical [Paraburkholderia nemoris]CAE6725624.1 Bis(5'-nucleosyl)-tetraphosphatase, symmetrical [Paraburkholderia nemoris]